MYKIFRKLGIFVVLATLIVVLVPLWLVHGLVCRLRSPRVGSLRELKRVAANDVDLSRIMRGRQPVIIENLMDSLDVKQPPDLPTFKKLAATTPETFAVRFDKDESPYYLYTGDYGRKVDHVSEVTLKEFLGFMFETTPGPGLCVYQFFTARSLNGMVGSMMNSVAEKLEALLGSVHEQGASGVWVGSKGVVTPLHHDAWPGLLFQTYGTKKVTMYGPTAYPNLYFLSPFSYGDRWSNLPPRSSQADPVKFPRVSRTLRYEGVLKGSDTLFIPPFWPHEMEALEANISMPFRFKVEKTDYLRPGALRPVYEVFHRKFLPDTAS